LRLLRDSHRRFGAEQESRADAQQAEKCQRRQHQEHHEEDYQPAHAAADAHHVHADWRERWRRRPFDPRVVHADVLDLRPVRGADRAGPRVIDRALRVIVRRHAPA